MISYTPTPGKYGTVTVRVDGKVTGYIRPVLDGFKYFVKCSTTAGDRYTTMDEVKRSLESD